MMQWLHRFRGRLWAFEDTLTVRQHIGLAAALLMVTLVGILAASAAMLSHRQVSDLLGAQLRGVATTMTDRLDRFMFTRQRELTLFAGLANVRQAAADPVELRRLLEQLQASFRDFAWIGLAGPDGRVIAATGGLLEGQSVAERPWFINGRLNITIEDVHEARMLSGLLAERPAADPYRFVDIALPVRTRDGHLIGVLGGHVNWDWPRELVAQMTDDDSGTSIWILARDGTMLLGPEFGSRPFATQIMREIRATRAGLFNDGSGARDHLTAYATSEGYRDYPGLEWTVVARKPADVALGAAGRNAWTIIFIGALVGIAGVVGAMLMAGRIARPIHAMTEEADRIGRTPGAAMFPRQRGSLEAVQLTRALRSLLRRIGFAEERTREAELRATENARQFHDDVSKLRKLAEVDDLTGLLNRRAFFIAAADAMNYYKRYKRPIAALMIDIDHFKAINDTHGHAAGDGVIKRVAELIGDCIRTTDKACRFGGEEFVVLLREVDAELARGLAERIRSTIEAATIVYGRLDLRITVSVGVATVSELDRDVSDLIERADQALYTAKNAGRNRVVFIVGSEDELARVA